MGEKLCQNSTIITLHDCHTHPIRQTWARAAFGSSECWKKSWRIESFIRMMKLKRWLRWSEMTSHSMRSRASFTIGWTDLDGSLRTGESTLLNKDGSVYLGLLSDGIGEGVGGFLYPLYQYIWCNCISACGRTKTFHETLPAVQVSPGGPFNSRVHHLKLKQKL
jgi:hypothetical protein